MKALFSTTTRFLFVCLSAVGASFAMAQSNAEINSGVQFNFSSPGARSLSLGGAFLGLADDATAAYTNPAGLTNLTRPEVSAEGRRFEYKSSFLDRGNAGGVPSGTGLDTLAGPQFVKSVSVVNSFSYASLVYPIRRFSFAAYWHELANFRTSAQTFGAFFGDAGSRSRFFPILGGINLRISSYGGSVAYRFGNDLSVGVGVAHFDYKQTTRVTRYATPDLLRSPPDYSQPLGEETVVGEDGDVAVNAGILWKPNRMFSVGAVYRQGPSFSAVATSGSAAFPAQFHVPDVFGIGIAFSPVNAVTITADYDRVEYSQLTKDIVDTRYVGLESRPDTSQYKIPDGNEGHIGLQWAIPLGITTLALRAGGWWDPDHKIRYNPDTPAGENLAFRGGKGVWHYTGGLGIAIGEHFQVDGAGDFSSTVNTGSVSMVARF